MASFKDLALLSPSLFVMLRGLRSHQRPPQEFHYSHSWMPWCICTTSWLNLLLLCCPLASLFSSFASLLISLSFHHLLFFRLSPSAAIFVCSVPPPIWIPIIYPLSTNQVSMSLSLFFSQLVFFVCPQPSLRTQQKLWLSRLAPSQWWWPNVRQLMANRLPLSSGWRWSAATTQPAPQTGRMARWRCGASIGWFPRRQIMAGRWPAWSTRGRRSGRGFTLSNSLWNVRLML